MLLDTITKRVLFAIILAVVIAILVLAYVFTLVIRSSQERGSEVATTNEQGQVHDSQDQETAVKGPVQIFYIVPGIESVSEDIGCGDSVRSFNEYTDRKDVIRFALEKLFSITFKQSDDGYYNALWQSNLSVGSIDIESKKVTINLEGNLVLTDECDGPRAQAQIETTAAIAARQQLNENPDELEIFIGGKTLHEAAGLR